MLSSGGIISLIIPIASASLLTTIGWRVTFVLMGVVGAIITVLYRYFIKLPKANSEEKAAQTAVSNQKGIFRSLFKTPMIWNLIIAYFCIYAVNWGLAAWIPTYLVKMRGLNLISLGWVQTIPGITMLAGIYLGGYR